MQTPDSSSENDHKRDRGAALHALCLAIYRPHANIWFRNNVGRVIRRDLLPNKYAPLLDHLRQADSVELIFVSRLEGGLLARLVDALELWLWSRLMGLKGVRMAWTVSAAQRAQVLFLMHYGNLTYENEAVARTGAAVAKTLGRLPLRKVVHMTHYAYCVDTGAANLAALGPDLLVAESNLTAHSAFFRTHFSGVKTSFVCLPYTAASRFQSIRPQAQRSNKLVVTGSITYKMQDPAFCSFFGTQELQPMRRALFEVANSYTSEMDCLVSDLNATRAVTRPRKIGQLVAVLRKMAGARVQAGYYKRDIVETYNSYTMFAVPEEVCGLPAIGFVEGMACGSAFVGVDGPMYRDLGMRPGVHFIAYDGSVDDLMAQVRHHQQHPERTSAIAAAGCVLAHGVLGQHAVYGAFVGTLRQLAGMSDARG